MSLKQEIETWVTALERYDNNEFDEAVTEFEKIGDTSKILFNMGVIHATLGEHEKAVECYQRAVGLDQYLAVAYFQQGVSNFLLGDFEEALANFNDTLLYLRGNTIIDYSQLGLLFKLYSCEVLFNRGLCYMYLQQREPGMQDFMYAVKEKIVEDHNVIDEAIRDEAEGYTVFSIPVGVVYRPNDAKVRNLKTKDYLGKAKLVATSDRSNAFTGFTGSEIKKSTTSRQDVKDDRPADNISFAATNLVRPDLRSRRDVSEPPADRNVFPPTPPPEAERSSSSNAMSRGASVRNGTNSMRPPLAKLNIQTQDGGSRRYEKAASPPDNRTPLSRSATATSARSYSRDPLQRRPTLREEDDPMSAVSSAGPRGRGSAYPSDLYDMYQQRPRPGSRSQSRGPPYQTYQSRRMDPEDPPSDYDDGSVDEGDFDMLPAQRPARPGTSTSMRSRSRRQPPGQSQSQDVRKIRIKAYAADDVRYILIDTGISYPDFLDKVRDKFGLAGRRFKVKMRDEDMPDGEKITMGDQDDLEMAIMAARSAARRDRQEVGKLDIWIFEI
ncbi:Tetratricopeptide (TPR) repeat [Geosmithia morbida]|uniref:Tetratricopeptide (TPR) repeat n=1 Tax=Geosmithia morbida TaxID=1094350 RepID=A0A9P4YMK8_9HYPO|nr:Tetratricopeptide (TPR) repeat [Geosmithia morbida]KAF4119738.1 Tetratricopeptide (TPR) repeat [Geosmithia morbida]